MNLLNIMGINNSKILQGTEVFITVDRLLTSRQYTLRNSTQMKNSIDFLNFIQQQVKTVPDIKIVLKTFEVNHHHDYKTK